MPRNREEADLFFCSVTSLQKCETRTKGLNRLKTQADEGLTTADEAGYVVLRQPPASKLANLFRIDVRDHALGLVTQQLGGRVTEHPPAGWLGPRTPSLREGPGSASVPSGSPDPAAGTGAPARPCGRGKLAQFSLLQRFPSARQLVRWFGNQAALQTGSGNLCSGSARSRRQASSSPFRRAASSAAKASTPCGDQLIPRFLQRRDRPIVVFLHPCARNP